MAEIKGLLENQSESVVNVSTVETRPLVDQKPEAMVPREVKNFLQRIEETPTATPTFDPTGQPQLSPSTPTNPKVTLPVTRTSFLDGFKKTVDDVGHWLSIFLFREIKLKKSNVSFKPDDS